MANLWTAARAIAFQIVQRALQRALQLAPLVDNAHESLICGLSSRMSRHKRDLVHSFTSEHVDPFPLYTTCKLGTA